MICGLCFPMFRWHLKFFPFAFQEISLALVWSNWGVGGWGTRLLDRYAQCRLLTRNTIKGQKGVHNYTFSQIFTKNRGWNTTFPIFFSNIGVETTQIFQRPEKRGLKWWSICSSLHIARLHWSNTASTWETWIRIWTTCLFLDANIASCRMPSVM